MERLTANEALNRAARVLADTDDTEATLRAAWQAFRVADAIARAMAASGGQAGNVPPPPCGDAAIDALGEALTAAPPTGGVRAAIDALSEALAAAPSLTERPAPDLVADIAGTPDAGKYLLVIGLALNTALPEAAELAAGPGDRSALYRAAAAGRDLACCYSEGMRPHLTEAAAFVAAEASSRYP